MLLLQRVYFSFIYEKSTIYTLKFLFFHMIYNRANQNLKYDHACYHSRHQPNAPPIAPHLIRSLTSRIYLQPSIFLLSQVELSYELYYVHT